METKFKRLDHKSLVALLLVITRMIKADSRIDAGEIQKLMVLEQQYNFDHTLKTEANRLTLSDAIKQLKSLDLPTRRQILQSLTELGSTDRILERHEALLLLTLRYCLLDDEGQQSEVISSHKSHRSGDLGTYIIYFEAEDNENIHRQIFEEWELMKLMLQQNGLQFFFVEHIVQSLCKQDPVIIKKMLEYFAPTKTDEQIGHLYDRIEKMDSSTFCQQVFVRSMEMNDLRNARPSLLINLGSTDLLRIEIADTPQAHIRRFLNDYNRQASPGMTATCSYNPSPRRVASYFGPTSRNSNSRRLVAACVSINRSQRSTASSSSIHINIIRRDCPSVTHPSSERSRHSTAPSTAARSLSKPRMSSSPTTWLPSAQK